MTPDSQAALPELTWTWCSPKYGWLATIIRADGLVRQSRLFSPKDAPAGDDLGRIPPEQALQALALSREALKDAGRGEGESMNDYERVELHLLEGAENRSVCVAVSGLKNHPALVRVRQAVLSARRQTGGGFFSWRSPGGRLTWLLLALMVAFAWWIIRDWRAGDRMAREASRVEGTVTAREGESGTDRNKFIKVNFTPPGGTDREVKISEYLSAENWSAASPGSRIKLWHLSATDQTYLESDIMRWNGDKKWIVILPLGIAACMFPIIWSLRRHRVGVHEDGQEYLIKDDAVTADDKAAMINRTKANFIRLAFRLCR